MTFTNLLISTYTPFPSLSLSLPSSLPISSLSTILSPLCPPSSQSLSFSNGRVLPSSTSPLSALNGQDGKTVFLSLGVKLPGGKGGFASQLRAQGGRMSSNKASNNDSCRDLNGRRLSTIKEAKKLAALIESEPDRQAAATKAASERLEKLHKEIERLDNQVSGNGGKRRLEDDEFVEKSKEMVEGVRDAVKEAMLKKRKKAKLASASTSTSTSTSSTTAATTVASSSSAVLEPVVPSSAVEKEEKEEVAEKEEKEEEEKEEKGTKKGKGKKK